MRKLVFLIPKKKAAEEWINWMFSEKAINLIKEVGVTEYGQPLFIPNPSK